jgi:hypothetical protein
MHLVICTRTEAYVVNDRRGTLLESVRRFFRVLSRLFPETTFENCEWRSTLADWPEVDAFLSIPRQPFESSVATVMEVFIQYFLESATMQKRLRGKTPLELAYGRWAEQDGCLLLTPQKLLRFEEQETFAFIRSESMFPGREAVENLDRRKFRGLACRVASQESGIRGQESGIRSQESEVRSQRSEVRIRNQ